MSSPRHPRSPAVGTSLSSRGALPLGVLVLAASLAIGTGCGERGGIDDVIAIGTGSSTTDPGEDPGSDGEGSEGTAEGPQLGAGPDGPGQGGGPTWGPGDLPSSPPPFDSTASAGFADVASHCASLNPSGDSSSLEEAPPFLPLPPASADGSLPSFCDAAEVQTGCGTGPTLSASNGAGFQAALFMCMGACTIQLEAGEYVGSFSVPPCATVVGQGDSTLIRGSLSLSSSNVVRQVRVEDDYGAISGGSGVLLDQVTLRGGYEGYSSSWDATDTRVCRSRIAAGYSGAGISWQSSGLKVASSSIAACYEGLALSWGSSDLVVVGNLLYGDYSGVGTSWGSTDVTVVGNLLGSAHSAVDIHLAADGSEGTPMPDDFAVLVTNNLVVSGSLPPTDAGLGITVSDNQ